jgi:hypothetical protein
MRTYSWNRHLLWLTLTAILYAFAGARTSAQVPISKLCSSEFFSSESHRWAQKDHEFHLVKDGEFVQGQNLYVLAVAFEGTSESRNSGDWMFLIFQSPLGQEKFTPTYAEKVRVLNDFGEIRLEGGGCLVGDNLPYFRASVVDLAGDGNQKIIVESNSIGACSSCRSLVQVYQVQGNRIAKAVEEYYDDIKFSRGQGLWIQSSKLDSKGQPVAYQKSFFTKNRSDKKPGD